MKLWAIKRGYRLEPANAESQTVMERVPSRKLLKIDVLRPRNAKHNALYWVFLERIAAWLDQDDVTADVMHDFFKLECGVVVLIRLPNGEIRKQAASTAFDNMDQDAFNPFFEKAVRIAYEKLQVPPAILADLLTPTLRDIDEAA